MTTAKTKTATRKRPARYDSPVMAERRRMILEMARTMLGNDENITMRVLAANSGVALATLYNQFGNQDQLLAAAVVEVFEEILDHPWDEPGIDFFTAADRLRKSVFDEIVRVPAFARKMVATYFDTATENPIRDTLFEASVRRYENLLSIIEREGELAKWVGRRELAKQISGAQYSQIARWAAGAISIKELEAAERRILLMHVAAATTGKTAQGANERLYQE